jgi:DNA-binding NarL/FixJ family response regulator
MRTVIIAESPLEAEVLRRALRYGRRLQVVGYIDARRGCQAVVAAAAPELVVVEDGTEPERTLERIREARSAAPDAKVVLLSRDLAPGNLDEASVAGVDAVIDRQLETVTLGILVGQVAQGTIYHAFGTVEPTAENSAVSELTARELEILKCVASGATNNQIAKRLWVTEQTVKFHLSNTYRKLGVANRTEASHYAHVHGLLRAEPAERDTYDLSAEPAAA